MYQKLASCQRDATTNTNLKHPNISSYCSPKGLPGSNISKILNILNIFNIEIIFYMPNTLNISNISLLDVCPKTPLDPSKAMVLVELQWSSCLRARQHLEVPHNHHHCNLEHHNYCEEKSSFNFLTFNSRRAKRMPRQALGPWPNPWKACGFLSIGHGGMRKRVKKTKYHLLLFSSVVQ